MPCRLLLTFPGVTDIQKRYASSNVPGTPVIALVDRGGVWPNNRNDPSSQLGGAKVLGRRAHASSTAPDTDPRTRISPVTGPPDTSGVPQPCAFTVKVLNAQNAGAAAVRTTPLACPSSCHALHLTISSMDVLQVIVVDNRPESLITMDAGPDDDSQRCAARHPQPLVFAPCLTPLAPVLNSMEAAITVPAALLTQAAGDSLKAQLALQNAVIAVMSWQDVVPHSGPTVAWELWSNSNDECGVRCDIQQKFINDFAPAAIALQRGGYTTFTPHYITLSCGASDPNIPFCQVQCINNGRYCQLDPDGDLSSGYSGKDVVLENLRSLCVSKEATSAGKSWLWWQFITQIGTSCSLKKSTYSPTCADAVISGLGLSPDAVRQCMGDTTSDMVNPVLQGERDSQISNGRRGDIAFFPTLIANGVQYRGDIENASVLEFVCSGFNLADAPSLCLGDTVITNPCGQGRFGSQSCASRAGGDGATRCVDSTAYPYFTCACPQGSFKVTDADGVESCQVANACAVRAATVPLCGCPTCTCQVLPNGQTPKCSNFTQDACAAGRNSCWVGTLENGTAVNACVRDMTAKKKAGLAGRDPANEPGYVCTCPPGFKGDGTTCTDIDECRDIPDVCPNPHQVCVNRRGSYWCGCEKGWSVDLATRTCYQNTSPQSPQSQKGVGPGGVFAIVFFTLAGAAGCAYGLYRWRLKQNLNNEVRSIMSNYLPLGHDNLDDDAAGDFKPLRSSPLDHEAL